MDNTNPWTRRGSRGSKLTVSTSVWDTPGGKTSDSPRTPRRFAVDSHTTRSNPFNPLSSLPGNPSSPSTPASSAFRLGSGAFASFGSSGKQQQQSATKSFDQKAEQAQQPDKAPGASSSNKAWSRPKESKEVSAGSSDTAAPAVKDHPLKATWIVWYRPPTSKYSDYEKSTIALASISTVESFWAVYSHLKHPSQLPAVSDYHIFRKDIRPVWEDDANKKGGKWIVRLKKGVADRYWEELLLALVGDQFGDAGDEICGAVLSVRSGEDVLSVWTRIDGGRNIRIRETMKRLLAFPSDTNIQWKSHDDSIAQRAAVDQARHEKAQGSGHHHHHHHHHRNHDHHNQGTDRRRQQQQQHHHHHHHSKESKDNTTADESEKTTQ